MDKLHVRNCSTCGRNLPGRLAMLSSLLAYQLAPCVLLVLLAWPGEGRPDAAPRSAPVMDTQRTELLKAVKAEILSSLGMEREPSPARKASEEELRSMYWSYWEKLREMGGNSSQIMGEAEQHSSVHLGKPIKELWRGGGTRSGGHLSWYRAVFQRSHHIQAELMLARAELKVSRQILDRNTSALVGQEIKVKINRRKRVKSAAWMDANLSGTEEARLDIGSEVERWMRSGGRQELVVDVGIAVDGEGQAEGTPNISLELDLRKPKETHGVRAPRSVKEDDCSEQGLCCQKVITVSFKDIGWSDWVVAPAEYTMHFCDGACPHNYRPASMHTQVKSRLHHMTKGGTPRPCCVPAAYEPMVLMHYDSRGKLKLTAFEDLIVSKCHCA